ncbi:hypothetical protein V5F53_05825 [Xanthobacter sp. V4C-4]|uniref:hypothetical protein n=1 Tax=Xanthobacter cornucopiae TaxID=3119924 RepID=UPI003729942A
MLKPLAAEAHVPTTRPAGTGRVPSRVGLGAFDPWPGAPRALSAADPDTLARAVRAHKAGDAFAQAALTLALMLAIGAVAFVLSTGRAAAAGVLVEGVADHAAVLSAVALAGGGLLLAARARMRRARVRADDRRRR